MAKTQNSLTQMCNIKSLLEDEFLFEEILRKAYQTQVVFHDLLRAVSSELGAKLGRGDPLLDGTISATLLSYPFREKFFAKLAKVAQG